MSRIVVGCYMVRYPLGGMLSSALQWLLGLKRLGHEVYAFERAGYHNSCYDPSRGVMTDDCTYGVAAVDALLRRFDLGDHWCYLDASGEYHGRTREQVAAVFESADLFIDRGAHGAWLDGPPGSSCKGLRLLIDGEPAFNQIKMCRQIVQGNERPTYDHYYTVGQNVGESGNPTPTAGKPWRHFFHPVDTNLVQLSPLPEDASFTTVMNWQSHAEMEFNGRVYGQKDVEFRKFMSLPGRTGQSLELAVAGKQAPKDGTLSSLGWKTRDAHEVAQTFDSYLDYIGRSKGEFSVAKQIFVDFWTGWFSDRSALYLAMGRPVVMQDTGFSQHLPTGCGLFAVRDVEEAADAIERVTRDYDRQSRGARDIAREYLDASKVISKLLAEVGI